MSYCVDKQKESIAKKLKKDPVKAKVGEEEFDVRPLEYTVSKLTCLIFELL